MYFDPYVVGCAYCNLMSCIVNSWKKNSITLGLKFKLYALHKQYATPKRSRARLVLCMTHLPFYALIMKGTMGILGPNALSKQVISSLHITIELLSHGS
jgi:hypothetical protein